MQGKLREVLPHALVALLFSAGMTLTILNVMGLMVQAPLALLLLAGMVAVLSLGTLDRRVGLLLGGVATIGCLAYLALGGFGAVIEVMQAMVLHMSGLRAALPLVATRAAVLVTLLCGLASFFVTYRSAGAYPALVLLMMAVVLLWLSDQVQALWPLLPAVVACVTLLLQSGDESTRTSRVLPLALVTTLFSFTGVAIGGAVIPPLKDAADDLRQKIYDVFFFTDPRDVFTLATEGYYPQGQGQLGGPATPREVPVMAVITPHKTYLRGVVKNVYTGRSWLDETGGRRYLWSSGRWQAQKSEVFDMARPIAADRDPRGILSPDTVTVRMLGDSASTLFLPQRLRSLAVEGSLTPYFNLGSEIFATRNLELGDVWTVEAPLIRAGDAGVRELVQASANAEDANWAEVNRLYRALPDHLEQLVYDIAYEAAAGAESPYDMAVNIQRYLASHYTYTLDAPMQPPELDFVSTFLLLEKEGYCTHFASAMTVLCRMVGLPARYVEGYLATPDAEGLAIVTGKEGHAWTEVYFKGFGWLTFDATPWSADFSELPQDAPQSGDPPEEEPTPEPTSTPSPRTQNTPSPSPNPQGQMSTPTPAPSPDASGPEGASGPQARSGAAWFWLLLALIAAAVARFVWTIPSVCSARQKKPFARWLVWIRATHEALHGLSLVREPTETLMAFFDRVDASGKLPATMRPIAQAESLMFYGHAEPEPRELEDARLAYSMVCEKLSPGRKLLLALRRAFLPRRWWNIGMKLK